MITFTLIALLCKPNTYECVNQQLYTDLTKAECQEKAYNLLSVLNYGISSYNCMQNEIGLDESPNFKPKNYKPFELPKNEIAI